MSGSCGIILGRLSRDSILILGEHVGISHLGGIVLSRDSYPGIIPLSTTDFGPLVCWFHSRCNEMGSSKTIKQQNKEAAEKYDSELSDRLKNFDVKSFRNGKLGLGLHHLWIIPPAIPPRLNYPGIAFWNRGSMLGLSHLGGIVLSRDNFPG